MKTNKAPVLYIVIPCYNEQEVLPMTASLLTEKLTGMISGSAVSSESRIMFVNDGSDDKTRSILEELHNENPFVSVINLTCNAGHQNALLAGLFTAKDYADIVISMDADLQDDIDAMDEMVQKYKEGYDIVYGVRSSRSSDTFFKRFTAEGFYKLMHILGVDLVFNHADYRLMSKRAIETLSQFKEVNIFLRGIIPKIGYPTATVEYERQRRYAGETKYTAKKMFDFAFEGITSFSIRPIKMISSLGIFIMFVSTIVLIWCLLTKFFGFTAAGWTSILASIWLLGGIQLLCLGVLGEYVGKIYSESKNRPRYIIESILHDKQEKDDEEHSE